MSILYMSKAWSTALKGNDKLIFLALCDYSNDDGELFPSLAKIQKKCGVGKTTLTYILNAFEDIGVLKRTRRKRENGSDTSTFYEILTTDINIDEYKKAYKKRYKYKKNQQSEHPKINKVNTPLNQQSEHPNQQSEHLEPSLNLTITKKVNKKDVLLLINLWNIFANKNKLSMIIKNTTKRTSKIFKRIQEDDNFNNYFKQVLEEIEQSDFLKGKNNQNWKVDFDWLISNDTNYVKVLEGKYRNQSNANKANSDQLVDDYFAMKGIEDVEVING